MIQGIQVRAYAGGFRNLQLKKSSKIQGFTVRAGGFGDSK